jgi:hypothetical protein
MGVKHADEAHSGGVQDANLAVDPTKSDEVQIG